MKTLYKILPTVVLLVLFPFISFSQSCTITSKANDIIPDKLCAPVTVSWEVVYRGVDDGGTSVEIVFDWDDGTVETIPATNTDPSTQEWSVTATHVYPQGGNQCVYYPEATLQVNGVLCSSSSQQQMVTVWDVDTANGGHMEINPQVYHICVGNDATVTFQDVSTFNCVPPVEEDNPNETTRWTQWIYGTDYTINGVLIDGQTVSFPDTDAVVPITPPPVWSPQPPNEYSLPIYVPATAQVGQYFEITLRNWNYCNPYDDPSIPGPPADTVNGDHDPVITTAIIIIEPYPDATIDTAGPFCANDLPVTLTAATPGGTWSGNGITDASAGVFDPYIAGPGLHTVYYTVANAYGCANTDSAQILVYALPQPDILPGDVATVCPGYNLQLDGNPTPGDGNIVSHLWSGDVGNLNATDIQNPIFNTAVSGNYNMTYTVTDDNGCSNSDDIVVTVSAIDVEIMPEPADPCINESYQLFGNVSGGSGVYTSFLWTGETMPLSSVSVQNPVFTSSVADTFHLVLTVTDDNGCVGTDSSDVIVYQYPVPNAGPDDSVCGNTYLLSATPSTGVGNWYQLSGPGTAVFSDNTQPVTEVTVDQYGVYELVWREVTGSHCAAEDTVVIDFIEQPVADAGQDVVTCGLNVPVAAHPSVGTGTWSVVSGPGNGWFQNPNDSLTFFNADTFGIYQLVWTETNLICSDADTIIAHLNVEPYAHFLPENPEGCQPFTINFNNLTSNATSYNWDFGDGATATDENPTHIFYNTTFSDVTYQVRLIASNGGCTDTTFTTVTVHPDPQSNFNYDHTPACSPHTVVFTNESTGAVAYHWLFDDGSPIDSADDAVHTFVNDTTFIQYFDVQLVAISEYGCTDTSSGFVTVYPNPDVNLTVLPDTLCSPGYATVMANPGYISYEWNYGDGLSEISTANQMQHFYTNSSGDAELYHLWVRAISQLGCVDTSYADLVVMPTPHADFTTDIASICGNYNLELLNTSSGADFYVWDFGDGTIDTIMSQQPIYHYYENNSNAPTTFYITLYAYNSFGCADTAVKTLLVYPEITADFVCDTLGCSPFTVVFDNQTNGAADYFWNFGDGTTSNSFEPVHTYLNTYPNPVIYDVSLVVTSHFGCQDTLTRVIHVYPSPEASFTASPSSMTMPNTTVSVNNTTPGGNWNCIWYWGNGDSSSVWQPGSYTYDSAGVFTIVLVVYNEYCSDTAYQTVTIVPSEPVAGFEVDANEGCVPFTVHFTNTSIGGSVYVWDFGDGTSSHEENPEHTYTEAGTYNVHFTVTGQGGSDAEDLEITVYPTPKAFFKVVPSEVSIPGEEIKCYNQSEGAVSFLWNFGDGTTSTLENPVHEYTETGVYTIVLTVWNEHQCEDQYVQNDAVTAVSAGEIEFPNAFTPDPTGPNGGHYNANDFSNDVFHPIYKGVVEYELNIFNRWGELIFVSKDPKIGWDGYYRGKLCKQDVYVWKVRVKFSNGEVLEKVGDVTLLR